MSNATIKVFCYACSKPTNQKVLHRAQSPWPDDAGYVFGEDHYLLQCAGCDCFNYAIRAWEEHPDNPYGEEWPESWRIYPEAGVSHRQMNGFESLPTKIRIIYKETVDAMNARLAVLSGIGLRALIEAICIDRGCKGALNKMIDDLAKKGVITSTQATILHNHRFLGNAAAHEIVVPHQDELEAAMEIAESTLRSIFILPLLSERITTGKRNT